MSNHIDKEGKEFCGFCGKTKDRVYLLQADSFCSICDECVDDASQNIFNKKIREIAKKAEDLQRKKGGVCKID